MKKKDFHAVNDGSIILLLPLTDQGRQFIDEYLSIDSWQDPQRVAIEPRYWPDISAAIAEQGLTIEA